jgi:hypothetical protein
MSKPALSREVVHALSEAVGNAAVEFQPTATRLLKEQRPLARFFEQNAATLGPAYAQVATYMLSVSMRVLEQTGRLRKVSWSDLEAAQARVGAAVPQLMPADKELSARAKAIDWRAQPHLLDEILWALYDRSADEHKEGEVEVPEAPSALIYFMLWTAVEALDANWTPARA